MGESPIGTRRPEIGMTGEEARRILRDQRRFAFGVLAGVALGVAVGVGIGWLIWG